MKRSTRPQWPKVLGVIAVLIPIAAPKLWRTLNREGRATHLFDRFVERIDHTIGWHRLPTWLSVISLIGIRHTLRQQNLYSTDTPGIPEPAPPHARCGIRWLP